MTRMIDLNADLGEDESEKGIARDIAIIEIVSSCNIACGGHAGSSENMRRMLKTAKKHGVAAGAHPSYPDRENFGRKSVHLPADRLTDAINEQVDALLAAAEETGTIVTHLKPHGALYNDAQDDAALAIILTEIAAAKRLALVGMAHSECARAAHNAEIPFIAEAFIDRRYTGTLRLQPRGEAGAVIEDEDTRLAQAIALASGASVELSDGSGASIEADTLCLHSDSDGALETARAVRAVLEERGFEIAAVKS